MVSVQLATLQPIVSKRRILSCLTRSFPRETSHFSLCLFLPLFISTTKSITAALGQCETSSVGSDRKPKPNGEFFVVVVYIGALACSTAPPIFGWMHPVRERREGHRHFISASCVPAFAGRNDRRAVQTSGRKENTRKTRIASSTGRPDETDDDPLFPAIRRGERRAPFTKYTRAHTRKNHYDSSKA